MNVLPVHETVLPFIKVPAKFVIVPQSIRNLRGHIHRTILLIDTHAHLYLKHFDQDIDAVERRARDAGLEYILLPNVDGETTDRLHQLTERNPDFYLPMMGLHPCSVHPDTMETELQRVEALHRADDFRYYAVGEIGLDYYWDTTHVDAQKEAFQRQIQWAIEMDLPIVIHNRDSAQDSVELVRRHQNGALRGVFHCFTGTAEEAHAMLDLGFYLGIGGVVTFKNSHLRETLKQAPLERIILETDAPYLAPTPYRGKRNESAYVQHVAECLAHEVYNITYEELARRTSDNARQLFRIP